MKLGVDSEVFIANEISESLSFHIFQSRNLLEQDCATIVADWLIRK